jgi:hypothetical protein
MDRKSLQLGLELVSKVPTATIIAARINLAMLERKLNVATISNNNFYTYTGRKIMKDGFRKELKKQLATHKLEITFGAVAVVIHKDLDFNPLHLNY